MEKILVNNGMNLRLLCDDLDESSVFAYDCETNAKPRFQVNLVGLSFAGDGFNDRAYYVPLLHNEGKQLPFDETLEQLKPYFLSEREKICHNAKYDQTVLQHYDIDVQGYNHDTIVMAWLLKEKRTRGSMKLKTLVPEIFGHKMQTYEEVINSAPKKRGEDRDYNFAKVPVDDALEYAADDAYWCWKLFQDFIPKLQEEKLWDAYLHVEGPFTKVIRRVEDAGAFIHKERIDRANEEFPKIMDEIAAEIYKHAGKVFLITSGAQLGKVLFEDLKLHKNPPRTEKGQYKTDKKVLAALENKHPIVKEVQRFKKIKKTHSTFVEGLRDKIAIDGKLHANFNANGTVTGRLSSSNPNLQNIEGDEVEDVAVRNFFIPSPGNMLVVADYSQVEYRVMAHFSKDEEMLAAFAAGEDFHEEAARRLFEIPADREVTARERFHIKAVNFGIGYGRGPKSVAAQLGMSQDKASELIASWYKKFIGVHYYKEHVVRQARKQGFIRTLAGRKRRLLPEIRSDNWKDRGHAERQAFNTKIQGSAADIIKMAMNALDVPLEKEHDARMIIQIHDELVVDCPEAEIEGCVETMKFHMENPLNGKSPLRLPLVTKPKIVEQWGDAK